jgi:hypothetical protein
MQITLNLDESLLNEALQLTKLATQEELVTVALQEFVRSLSVSSPALSHKKNLLDLAGKIKFTPDFDYKALWETRHVVD